MSASFLTLLGMLPSAQVLVFSIGGKDQPSIFSPILNANLGCFQPQDPKLLPLRGKRESQEGMWPLKWEWSQIELCKSLWGQHV